MAKVGMWAGVFTCLGPRPLGAQDSHGARKRIRVGGLRTGVWAHPPYAAVFLHGIPNLNMAFLVITEAISQDRRINMFYITVC